MFWGIFAFVAQTTWIFSRSSCPATKKQPQGRPWHAFACLPASTRSTCCCPCCPEHEPSTLVPSTAAYTRSGHSMDVARNWDFKPGHDLHTCHPMGPIYPFLHVFFHNSVYFVHFCCGFHRRTRSLAPFKKFPGKKIETSSKHHFWVSCLGSLTYFCWRKDGGKGATFFRDMEGVQRGRVSEILLQKSKFPWDYITSSSLTPEKKNRRYVIEFPFGGAASASCKLFVLGRNSFQMSQLLQNQQPGPTVHRETNLVKQKQWQRKVRCFLRSFFEELYILHLAIESMKWPTMGILLPGAPNTLSQGYLDP